MSTMVDSPTRLGQQDDLGGSQHRRAPRRRLSKRGYLAVAFAAATLAVVMVWLFYFSSVFGLRDIVVEGVKGVSPEQIAEAADLSSGTPIMRIDLGAVEARVSDVASIGSVNVSRRWPGTLVITVTERQRAAAMKTDSGFVTIDAAGAAFGQSKRRPKGLLLLEAPEGPARTAAIQVIASLPPEIAAKVELVSATTASDVMLDMRNGVQVAWGGTDQLELKARVLRTLLLRTKDEWIDLHTADAPTSAKNSPIPAPPPSPTTSADPNASPSVSPLAAVTPKSQVPPSPSLSQAPPSADSGGEEQPAQLSR